MAEQEVLTNGGGRSILDEVEDDLAELARKQQETSVKVQAAIVEVKQRINGIKEERRLANEEFDRREAAERETLKRLRAFQFKPKEGAPRDSGVRAWISWYMLAHALGGLGWSMERSIAKIMEKRPQTYKQTAQKSINWLVREGLLIRTKESGSKCFRSILSINWDKKEGDRPSDELLARAKKIVATEPGAEEQEQEPAPESKVEFENPSEVQMSIIDGYRRKIGLTNDGLDGIVKNHLEDDCHPMAGCLSSEGAEKVIDELSKIEVGVESFASPLGEELLRFLGDEESKTMTKKALEWLRQGLGLTEEEFNKAIVYLAEKGVVAASHRSKGLLVAGANSRVADEHIKTNTKPLFGETEVPDHA